eukprot:TRINITY_DN22722_c0_g1_i1.p2 TRINITY_DN22722_c0_g1~~TRINITY_DN22722_c0_g1_i1.p2  ORF type:complete len:128 (-),score=14.72 TRINITY_DN22722_c0_g1_i1:412-795(-)
MNHLFQCGQKRWCLRSDESVILAHNLSILTDKGEISFTTPVNFERKKLALIRDFVCVDGDPPIEEIRQTKDTSFVMIILMGKRLGFFFGALARANPVAFLQRVEADDAQDEGAPSTQSAVSLVVYSD